MRRIPTIADALVVTTALALSVGVAGCGGSSSKAATSPPTKQTSAPGAGAGAGAGGGKIDLCGLLGDAEVTALIGAHKPGATGIVTGALYGDDSCLWASNTTTNGSTDSVEVAVLSGNVADESRAQDAAQAEPLPSFGHNARYNKSYSRLWFDCGSGEYCNVRVNTANDPTPTGDTRQAAAVKIGREILSKV
jgi:hypothetical protein